MIALDTNILVYATRTESKLHRAAAALVKHFAEGSEPWALPWPCVYEFLKVVTHTRIFNNPTSLDDALDEIEMILDSPSVALLGEGPRHRGHLRKMVFGGGATGNLVHDAHVAALVTEHGAELFSVDRDFARFPGIQVRNPFEPER